MTHTLKEESLAIKSLNNLKETIQFWEKELKGIDSVTIVELIDKEIKDLTHSTS